MKVIVKQLKNAPLSMSVGLRQEGIIKIWVVMLVRIVVAMGKSNSCGNFDI